MKVLKFIRNIIVGIVVVIFFAFTLFMSILLLNYNKYGVTQFDDTSVIIIRDEISSNNYKKGDLVLVKSKKIDKIKQGDEMFVYHIDESGKPLIDLGTVGTVSVKDNAFSFENGSAYSMEFAIGQADKVYHDVGKYLAIIQSKWGFLFMILVPCFLIFVYGIYALIVEIKYGNLEE